MGMNDVHSLSHSKWNCKYHIEYTPRNIGEEKCFTTKKIKDRKNTKGVM